MTYDFTAYTTFLFTPRLEVSGILGVLNTYNFDSLLVTATISKLVWLKIERQKYWRTLTTFKLSDYRLENS